MKFCRIRSSKTFGWRLRSKFGVRRLDAAFVFVCVAEEGSGGKAHYDRGRQSAVKPAHSKRDPSMKFGVIVFPGSNCDHDAYHVISKHVGQPVDFIWHRDTDLSSYDAVIIPGGFSYGDYLRAGALARFSPVMNSVKKFAESGRLVLGICNGFQILCEAGLLPGALIRNRDLHFICEHVYIRVETDATPFTSEVKSGSVLRIPIAHAEGNYVCDDQTFSELEADQRIVFRYCDKD